MAIFDLVVVTSTRDATNVYKYKRHGVSKSDIAIGHLGTSGRLARHRLVARLLFSSRGYVADGDGDVRVVLDRLVGYSTRSLTVLLLVAWLDRTVVMAYLVRGVVRLGSSLFARMVYGVGKQRELPDGIFGLFLGGRRFGL